MSQVFEVKMPGIGDAAAMPVIEVLVKVGDVVNVDDPICVLESDKATMDVPLLPLAWSRKCWPASAIKWPKALCC
ncbi:hypothetical protein N5K35_30800 [Pseudomonas sp. GD03651]|uniref:biotin/lipoyl-containing protein n=1 Tax=Pseudomonas sp. GD03651 TaxID=2975361 RepID=UPI0024487DE2|nr:biotin/lipoyl-containing protein [Pseudomonas sp. GD03651]MDH2188065.1 hypothetical protein [Pseudomonas sp. GD03651]